MAENSKIEWTSHTFNPWRGCTKISPGCTNCYAETLSGRNPGTLGIWGPKGTRVVAAEATWKEPLKWERAAKAEMDAWLAEHKGAPYEPPRPPERPRVFCASLADVFEDWQGPMVGSNGNTQYKPHASMPNVEPLTMADVRARLFALIDATPHLNWLLLTKRPENIAKMMPDGYWIKHPCPDHSERFNLECPACNSKNATRVDKTRPNLWLGVSVENQEQADKRIPLLLQTPAAVRFLSCEPLLGPVDLRRFLCCHWCRTEGSPLRADNGETYHIRNGVPMPCPTDSRGPLVDNLHLVIVGGESGPGARPFVLGWGKDIVRQCQAAGVPVFVKQVGSNPTNREGERCPHIKDRKGGVMDEWPEALRIRQFPEVPAHV